MGLLETTFFRCVWTWHNGFKSIRSHIPRFLDKKLKLTCYTHIFAKKCKNQKILLTFAIYSQKTSSYCLKLRSFVAFGRGTTVSSQFEPMSLVFLTKSSSLHGIPIYLQKNAKIKKYCSPLQLIHRKRVLTA